MLEHLQERGIDLTEDEYRTGLRALFPEDYQELSDEQLEDIIYERIAQMSPSEAEGFFSSIGNFFKEKVAPVAFAALPAVATIAGTVLGGPLGAAAGGFAGKLASDALSKATNIRPNQAVSNIGRAATSIASGNFRAAIPSVINVGRDAGNAISRGAGNRFANVASGVAQAGSAIASGNYGAAIPGVINAGRHAGNMISPGAGNRFANVTSNVAQAASGFMGQQAQGANAQAGIAGSDHNPVQASAQLLSFLKSTPFLQNILSSIATGNPGTGVQMLRQDGSSTTTSYMEMLESLKYLTENALAEADNLGVYIGLPLESETDRDAYIESLVEGINNYENTLLPNYDNIVYN